MRCKRFLATTLLTCLAACAPDGGAPVRMAVLQWKPGADAYDLEVVEVRTLEDVRSLRGEAGRPIGAASIHLDGSRLRRVNTEAEFRKAVLADPGADVEAQFLEKDGVLYPSDFHSLSLATAYFNFETARLYALARGMDARDLLGVPFYYFPELTMAGATGQMADNAAWYPLLRSFLLFPFHELQGIPLAINQGVIAHEYGHGIFNAVVHAGSWSPDYPERWSWGAGRVMVDSIEEGFADAWAVGASGDLSFVARSIHGAEGPARDLAFDPARHCFSQAAFDQELRMTWGRTDHWDGRKYEIGTMWASALHQAGQRVGTDFDRVMDALLASYRRLGERLLRDRDGSSIGRFSTIATVIVESAPDPSTRTALCATLMDRFSLTADELEGRCDGVAAAGDCR